MQRGDVVWARVVFPHTWWPGLVISIDALGVLVSFFDIHPSRYFLTSELRSFESAFPSPMMLRNINNDDDNDELFTRALEVFGLRTIRSLTCPCQRRNGSGSMDLRRAKTFRAVVVLEFVLRMGMSPWVEKADFVEAIGAVAQVQAFRGYRSARQRLTYKGQKQRRDEMPEADRVSFGGLEETQLRIVAMPTETEHVNDEMPEADRVSSGGLEETQLPIWAVPTKTEHANDEMPEADRVSSGGLEETQFPIVAVPVKTEPALHAVFHGELTPLSAEEECAPTSKEPRKFQASFDLNIPSDTSAFVKYMNQAPS